MDIPTLGPVNPVRISDYPQQQEGYPTAPDENKIRNIEVKELNRGYVVIIGCHAFAFSEKEELIEKLVEYIKEPKETETKWFAGDLF